MLGKSFQSDPLLPNVHFATVDSYFAQVAAQPGAALLPTVSDDLHYTFEGCYTHADLKTAVRRSENQLYTAEALSALAATAGTPYPVSAFDDAWKPTAFAQFHDIMCGTAIHSTYDWMLAQLKPSIAFSAERTGRMVAALTRRIDTRGAKPTSCASSRHRVSTPPPFSHFRIQCGFRMSICWSGH